MRDGQSSQARGAGRENLLPAFSGLDPSEGLKDKNAGGQDVEGTQDSYESSHNGKNQLTLLGSSTCQGGKRGNVTEKVVDHIWTTEA